MWKNRTIGARFLPLIAAFAMIGPMTAQSDDQFAVEGVVGFDASDSPSWFAIKVAIPDSYALAGISWYNNDGLVAFPQILAGTGHSARPGDLETMTVIAENVVGQSSGWSALDFDQPVIASLGSIYVVFEVPAGSACQGRGEGGGPGFGYCHGDMGLNGWMSYDGESWSRLKKVADFAMDPVLVPIEDGMLVKSLGGSEDDETPEVIEHFMTAGPNPFNPRLVIRFGLPTAVDVTLEVFDLRGRRISRVLDENMAAGVHEAVWLATDDTGRGVASGIYFARLRHGHETTTKKIMLVR